MRNKNCKAFTLVELLAVIVILAIIAIIAIPIILDLIEDSNKRTFNETINGVLRAANIKATNQVIEDEILYKYQNGNWEDITSNLKLEIDGNIPKYVEVKINKEGQIRYAITDGRYCALKDYVGQETIKKIGKKNTDQTIKEKYCVLDPVLPTTEDCFKYTVNKYGTITINGYYTYEKNNSANRACPSDIIIPEDIDGIEVTTLAAQSFQGKNITSVEFPDTLTSIGNYAFVNNSKLTSITIPDSVTLIGHDAFKNNTKLTSLTLGSNLETIDYNAFTNSPIGNLIIPDSVKTIGSAAFQNCKLTNLQIGKGVTSIGTAAFNNNSLPENQAFIYARKNNGEINYSKIVSYGGLERNNVIIPEGVTTISSSSFEGNSLVNVTIPKGVTTIQDYAFQNNSLKTITIPNSVTSIGTAAFKNNKLPNDHAFIYNRKNTGEIDYTSLNSYGGEVRENVVIPEGVVTIGPSAFQEISLKSIMIPEGVITIGSNAFYRNSLSTVTIPASVTTIGNTAFGWNSLTEVIIKGNPTFSSNAFQWKSGCTQAKCLHYVTEE